MVVFVLFSLVVNAQKKDNNLPDGNEAFQEKNYDDAESNYRISASNNPKNAKAYYNLGNTIYTIKQPSEAKYAYENAIKITCSVAKYEKVDESFFELEI